VRRERNRGNSTAIGEIYGIPLRIDKPEFDGEIALYLVEGLPGIGLGWLGSSSSISETQPKSSPLVQRN